MSRMVKSAYHTSEFSDGKRPREQELECMDFSVNLWSLQFSDKSVQSKFNEGLIFQRAMILRITLIVYPVIFIYDVSSHAIISGVEKTIVSAALAFAGLIALVLILASFSKSHRKRSQNYCALANALLLLFYCLKSFLVDVRSNEINRIVGDTNYVVVVSALLGIGFQLNFLLTAALYVVYLGLMPYMYIVLTFQHFQEHEAKEWEIAECCIGCVVALTVTYILMLGRINNFVTFSKSQMAEKQVMRSAQRNKTQWIAQVAHDLGTPLATFSLGNQMLRGTTLSEEQKEIIATQETAVELMTITRNKGMDFAKLESGQPLKPHLRPMDVRELVESKCRRIMTGYGSENPMFFTVDSTIAKAVISDRDWIWEMLINYLNNAQKFTQTGRIVLNVSLTKNETFLRFEVADTGIGINDEQKKRLFKPYSQLQKGAGGTGLGLNSVMQKAKALGGSVGVRDNLEDGTGSVFWFDIPYIPDNNQYCDALDTTPPQSPSLSMGDSRGLSKGIVMVADDEKSILKFMAKSLEKHGFQVETAMNGIDAYRMLEAKIYQAVILDDQMPEMNGQDVCKRIRELEKLQAKDHPRQFILIVSGAPSNIPESTGYDHILCKPVNFIQLLNLLYANVCSSITSAQHSPVSYRRESIGSSRIEHGDPSSGKNSSDNYDSPKVSSSLRRAFFGTNYPNPTKLKISSLTFGKSKPTPPIRRESFSLASSSSLNSQWDSTVNLVLHSPPALQKILREADSNQPTTRDTSFSRDTLLTTAEEHFPHRNRARSSMARIHVAIEESMDRSHQSEWPNEPAHTAQHRKSTQSLVNDETECKSNRQSGWVNDSAQFNKSRSGRIADQAKRAKDSQPVYTSQSLQLNRALVQKESTPEKVQKGLDNESRTRPGSVFNSRCNAVLPSPTSSSSASDRDNFVLIVEDEVSILKFTARMFQNSKFQVHTAMNGLEGLEMMKRNHYLAVFTDINMPVMDGFECVRRFREWEKESQQRSTRQFICAVTANVSERDRESALATGLMDAFVAKPAKIPELIAIVKSSKCHSMLAPVTSPVLRMEHCNDTKNETNEESALCHSLVKSKGPTFIFR